MPKSLIFDEAGKPKEVISLVEESDYTKKFIWTHLKVADTIEKVLPDVVDRSAGFTEDLLESQRPRIQVYQTLEDNEDTYSVIVLSFPVKTIMYDDTQLQVSFLFLENRLYTAGSTGTPFFENLMKSTIKEKLTFTPILGSSSAKISAN